MNFSTSAKATISSNLRWISARRMPRIAPLKIDVLAPGQFRMETGADFEQAANAAVNLGTPGGRFGDAREQLEQGRLAGAVASDEAEHLARHHVEAHVAQRPHVALAVVRAALVRRAAEHRARDPRRRGDRTHDALAQRAIGLDPPDAVALGEVREPGLSAASRSSGASKASDRK